MPTYQLILINLGYFLTLIALVIRDILWLRIVLVTAQASLFVSAFYIFKNTNIAVWNLVFVGINLYQIIVILRHRKDIRLEDDLREMYHDVFSQMTKTEFVKFWRMGQIRDIKDEKLISQGEKQNELSLMLGGQAHVLKNGQFIADLRRGSFIAEMSFLTGEDASADVVADEEIRIISWSQRYLQKLHSLNPQIYIKIQNILGKDLVGKVRDLAHSKASTADS